MSKLWKYLAGGLFLCSAMLLGSCGTPTVNVSVTSYDMSKVSFNDSSFTYDGEEHSIFISGDLPSGVSVSYQGNQKVNAGEYKVTAKFTGAAESYTPISDLTANMTIAKASISGISFVGKSFIYDGQPHSLAIGGTLPAGVTVSYAYNGMTEAGTYSVVASFTDTTGNYNKLPDLTATMTISKADYDMSKVTFDSASYIYDGTEKRIEIKGTLPSGVSVSYKDNVLTDVGKLTAVASFSHTNKNYNDIPDKTATLTVSKSSLSGISFSGSTVTYDGSSHSIFVSGTLPSGVTVSYTNNGQTDAGSYDVTAHFSDSTGNYTLPPDMTAKLVINQASYDASGLSFNDASYTYDGTEKTLTVTGAIPEGVTVSYTNNKLTNVGSVNATATFAVDSNHKAIPSMNATLTITKSSLSGISFSGSTVTYDGNPHSLSIAGTLPSGVTVSYTNNGQTDAGSYDVVAHFSDSTGNYTVPEDMKATLTISKKTYDLSGVSFVSASYAYDGTEKTIAITGTLPDDVTVSYTDNRLTDAGSKEVTATFVSSLDGSTIATMKATLTITKKGVSGLSLNGATYVYDGKSHSLAVTGDLPSEVIVSYTNNGQTEAGTYSVKAHFTDPTGNYTLPPDLTAKLVISQASYPMAGVSFDDASYTYDGTEKTLTITGTLPDGVSVSYTSNALTDAGSVEVTATFAVDSNHSPISPMKATLTIVKASFTGISFSGNTVTYDGNSHSLAINGTLPTGVTVSYTNNEKTNAGVYTVTAHFADSTGNYNVPDDMTAKLTINKKAYDMTGVSFNDASFTYDGTEKTIVIVGSLPDGVTVSYMNNTLTNAGSVEATAAFAGDSTNYEAIHSMKATLTIGKKTVTGISLSGSTYTYDGTAKSISITGSLPSGVTVTYTNNGKTNAGAYSVTAHFADSTGNYTVPDDMTASLVISKASYVMTGVSFDSASYVYDGTERTLVITGTLPDGVTVSYTTNKMTNADTLTVTAAFTGDSANYNSIDSMTAVLTITKKSVTGISFNGQTFGYDGTSKSISVTGALPSGVTVSYANNGQTNVGEYTVTATFADSTGNYIVPSDMTAKITITKGTYDMSGVSFEDATYTYDGTEKTIAVTGTLPSGVTVSYTTNKMTNAGTLTVTASFTGDSANYNAIDSMTAVLTISGQKLSAPAIDYDGEWVEWSKVTGADYYIVTINGVDTKTTDLYLSVPAATRAAEFVITCKAYGNDSANIIPSDASNTLHRFGDITNIKVVDGVLTWDAIEGVEGYMLTINSTNVLVTTNSYAFADEAAGDMTVKVYAKGKDDTKSTFDGNASSGTAVTKLTSSFNLREEDDIIKWDSVTGATGYVLSLNGTEQTFDSTVTSYYVTGGVVGSNAIKVYALGDSTKYITGSYTSLLNVTKYPVPSNYKASGSRVSWDAVSGVTKYIVYVNGTEVDNGSNAYFELGDSYAAGSYTIKVKGYSSNANCVYSDYTAEIAVTKIGKVSGVAVVGGVLTWNSVDNAASYLVTVGSSKYTVSSDKTSYVVMDASGTYSVSVQAIGDGTSYFNGIASDSLSVTKIAAPVISYADGTISWAAVENATGYNLYINGTKVSNGTSTSYTLPIDGSASYAIAVEAVGDNAYLSSMSTYSDVASIGIPSLAVSGDGVSWKAVSDATGYILIVNGTSHCFDATVTSYSLNGQASGDYELQLVVVSNKSSSFSYSADGKKTITKLAAVTNIAASSGVLTWDAVANASSYQITIGTSVYTSPTNSLDLCGIAETGANGISVKAIEGTSYINADDSAKVSLVVLGSVANVSVSDGYFAWDAVESASGYEVEVNGTVYETSRNLYKITDGGTYAFRVRAIGSGTYLSSPYTSLKTYTKLAAPSGIAASGGRVSWGAVSGATKYFVSVNGTEVDNGSNTYFELGPSYAAGSYTIKVKAFSPSDGFIVSSFTQSIVVTKLSKVDGVCVAGGVLTWNAVENASSYLVAVGSSKYTVSSGQTSYAVTDAPGTYSITVQAIGDGTSYFDGIASDSLSITKIATPVISYADGTISWAAIDHATGYNLYINGAKVFNGASTSYVLPIGGSASYAIAVEAIGDSTYLSSMSTYADVTALGMPSLAANDDGIGWSAVAGATGYILVVNGTRYYYDSTVTSYSLKGQASGDYACQLIAVSCKSAYLSYSVEAEKTITKLAAVTDIVASNGVLAWDAVANASSYRITIGTSIYTSSTNSLDLGGIAETGANGISVKAIEGTSYINADDSAKASLTILGLATDVNVSNGVISWNEVANASGYEIEIDGAVYSASANSYLITTTESGLHSFRVRAVGSGTYLSSPYTLLKTYTKLSVPSNIKVSSGKLVWDAVSNAASYVVSINDVDYPTTSKSFLVPSSVTATLLSIKVKAVGDNALVISSEYSASQSFMKVAQSVISVAGGNTVSWTNTTESSVTSYTVSIGGTGGSSTNAGKVNTYTVPDEDISPLSNGEHTITLIAVGSDDRLSSCTDITINVVGINNVVVSDSNVITWDKVDGAASYDVTINGTVNTVSQSDAPSYDLGSNVLSSLTSIRAVKDNTLSIWTHFTVSIYKGTNIYKSVDIMPGSVAMTDDYGLNSYLFTDSACTTLYQIGGAMKKDLTLYYQPYYLSGGYLYYGLYPQTVVTDSALATALSALTTTNPQGYYEYQGYMYAKLSATPYQSGYKFNDNTTAVTSGTAYYFKVEPIKWRILKTSSGSYTLMSEQALDNQKFYKDTNYRTINGSVVYANNYMYSDIRTWLNAGFLNKAFYLDSSLIQTTTVDNSLASTGNSSNEYVCADTSDKVWLLNYAEAVNSSYGFSSSSSRYCVTTDYARARGCWMSTVSSYYGNCSWWLRSPSNNDRYSYFARSVDYDGYIINYHYVYDSNIGVRPALTISLS
jgi:hypothetical protein